MRIFQDTFVTCKRSLFSAFSVCITVFSAFSICITVCITEKNFVGKKWQNFGQVIKMFLDEQFSLMKLLLNEKFYPMNIFIQQILPQIIKLSRGKLQNFLNPPSSSSLNASNAPSVSGETTRKLVQGENWENKIWIVIDNG